jgi:hypothetical protein
MPSPSSRDQPRDRPGRLPFSVGCVGNLPFGAVAYFATLVPQALTREIGQRLEALRIVAITVMFATTAAAQGVGQPQKSFRRFDILTSISINFL